jgi:hypothetical protein
LYPGSLTTPVEVEQFRGLMMENTPDILITPSDLMLFAKVSALLTFYILFSRTSKVASVSIQVLSTSHKQLGDVSWKLCCHHVGGITVDPLVMHHEETAADILYSNRAGDRIRVDIHNI